MMLGNGENILPIQLLLDDVRVQLTQRPINKGRLCRGQYLLSMLVLLLITSVASRTLSQFPNIFDQIMGIIISLGFYILSYGLSVRRLNDIGHGAKLYTKIAIFLGITGLCGYFLTLFGGGEIDMFVFIRLFNELGPSGSIIAISIIEMILKALGVGLIVVFLLQIIVSIGIFFIPTKMPDGHHGIAPIGRFEHISNRRYALIAFGVMAIYALILHYGY